MIALLKEELRVLEPEMEFEDSTCRSVQREVRGKQSRLESLAVLKLISCVCLQVQYREMIKL